nr:uncharacterized protein LOC128705466 [Cherax quadricarinatus]
MSINEKLFYGEQSTSRSRYDCVSEESDSEAEVDEPELLDSGDEYLPPDAQVSSDDEEEERPAKKTEISEEKVRYYDCNYCSHSKKLVTSSFQCSVCKVNLDKE